MRYNNQTNKPRVGKFIKLGITLSIGAILLTGCNTKETATGKKSYNSAVEYQREIQMATVDAIAKDYDIDVTDAALEEYSKALDKQIADQLESPEDAKPYSQDPATVEGNLMASPYIIRRVLGDKQYFNELKIRYVDDMVYNTIKEDITNIDGEELDKYVSEAKDYLNSSGITDPDDQKEYVKNIMLMDEVNAKVEEVYRAKEQESAIIILDKIDPSIIKEVNSAQGETEVSDPIEEVTETEEEIEEVK